MPVMMNANATVAGIDGVCRKIEELGYRAHPIPGIMRTAIGITGNQGAVDAALDTPAGVAECMPVSKPYKLVSREPREDPTVMGLGDGVRIGGRQEYPREYR